MTARNLDTVRAGVLGTMDADNRRMQYLIIGAALVEAGLIAGAIALTIWTDPLHRLVIAVAAGTWTLMAIGFAILGAHVSRVASRIVAALTPDG